MDLQHLIDHGLGKPGTTQSRPFGPDALVLKVHGKIFAIIGDEAEPPTVSLKCEPDIAPVLREMHESVAPGYHLDKRHWNTVSLDGSIPPEEILDWVDDSYDLVVDGLPRTVRSALRDPP